MSVVEALYQCSGLLAVLILFATGVLILLLDAFSPLGRKGRLGGVSVAGTAAAVLAAWRSGTTGEPLFFEMVVWDRYALFVASVILLGALLVLLLSLETRRRDGAETGEYYALVLFAATGMVLMAQAVHFIMIFLGLEILSISVYVLVGLPRHERRANEAALKYVLLGGFASGFFLYGLTFLYGAAGSLSMTAMASYLGTGERVFNSYLLLGTALVLVGFAFKLALVPFHLWAPDVYEGAPTPITAYMAVGVKAAVLAALVRTFWEALPAVVPHWTTALWILAAVTMTVGNVMALVQQSVKRMLAYSSIAHAGYLLVAVVAGSPAGVTALLVYLLAYTVMNVGAFGVMAAGQKDRSGGELLQDFEGLGFRSPLVGAVMALFLFSLAGIPPTAGFLGKLLVFSAAVEAGYTWLVVLAVINSVVAAYYYLRVVIAIYRRSEAADAGWAPAVRLSGGERAALILAALLTVGVGVLPQDFWELARRAVLALG